MLTNYENDISALAQIPESITLEGFAHDRSVMLNGHDLEPRHSQKIRNHSPDGFNWGYGGSGPAQLALAVLLEISPNAEFAQRYYQDIKFSVIAALPSGEDFCKRIWIRSTLFQYIHKRYKIDIDHA